MDEKKYKVLSTKVPPELLDELEEAKWALRMNKGDIIVEAIREYIRNHVEKNNETPAPKLKRRTKA